MKRAASAALFVLISLCSGSTPQVLLSQRYKQFNSYIQTGDAKSMSSWLERNCAGKFSYTSFQKAKFDRAGYIAGVLGQIKQTQKVLKSLMAVRSFQRTGNSIVATVASDFKGQILYDTRKLIITDQSVTNETWFLVKKEWILRSVVQVSNETQVHDEDGD
jgi:hypothetical protein